MNLNNEAKAREILARSPWCSQQDALKAWEEAVALLKAEPGDGLPPLGSTVRIVSVGLRVWPDAEKFFGADCTLCAVFMTGDTQMVAVEHQADAVCCCFVADMVRTPEQAAEEERRQGIEDIWNAAHGCISKTSAGEIYNAGYRKQVTP